MPCTMHAFDLNQLIRSSQLQEVGMWHYTDKNLEVREVKPFVQGHTQG